MIRLVIVLLCACLMGSAMAAEGDKQAEAQKSSGAATAANPDKVIGDILSVSGIKVALGKLSKSYIEGLQKELETAQRRGSSIAPEVLQAMEASAKESYTAQGFIGRVRQAMKKDYNEKNYQELLADLSTPVARHMEELETKEDPTEDVLTSYIETLRDNPLPSYRQSLLKRLDVASNSTDMLIMIMAAQKASMMLVSAANSSECISGDKLERAAASMKEKMEADRENYSQMMQIVLAYTYREADEAALSEYLRIYEKKNSEHIHKVIYSAIEEEFSYAGSRVSQAIAKAAAKKNPACDKSAGGTDKPAPASAPAATTAPAPAPAPAPAAPVPAVAPVAADSHAAETHAASTDESLSKSSIPLEQRKGGDATECLSLPSNKEIILCAEKYRDK